MSVRRSLGVLLFTSVILVCACESSGREHLTDESLDLLFTWGPTTAGDTSLLSPEWLVASRGGIVVGDPSNVKVTSFNAQGAAVWTYDQRGAGPTEMGMPIAGAVANSESVWVLDAALRRLIQFDDTGRLVRQMALPVDLQGIPIGLALISDEEAVVQTSSGALARVTLSNGALAGQSVVQWETEPPEGWWGGMSFAAGDGGVAVGMSFGPEIQLFTGAEDPVIISDTSIPFRIRPRRVQMGEFAVPDPTDVQPVVAGAYAMEWVKGELWVLTGRRFGGESPTPNDRIVVYNALGAKVRTLRLPIGILDFAVRGDTVFGLVAESVLPTIGAFGRR